MYSESIVRIIPMITEDFLVSIGLARGPLTQKLAGEGTETADIYLRSPFRSWDHKNIVGTALLRAFATVSARQQVIERTPLVWEEYQERAGGIVVSTLVAKECAQDELACARLIHLALIGKEINITGQYGIRCREYGGLDDGEPPSLKRASVVFFNSGFLLDNRGYQTKMAQMRSIMVNSKRVIVSGDRWGRGVPDFVSRETVPEAKAPPKPSARTSKGKKQAPVAPLAEPKKEGSGYLGRVFSFDLDD